MDSNTLALLGQFFKACIEMAENGDKPSEVGGQRLGKKEAAKYVGWSVTTFMKLVRAKEIPGHQDRGQWMFFVRDLDRYNSQKSKGK